MRVGSAYMRRVVRGDVWSSAIASVLRRVVHWYTGVGLGRGCMGVIRLRIRGGRQVVCARIRSSSVVLAVTEIATGRLRAIRNNLHTSRYNSSRTTTSRSVRRRSWASESFVQLLKKGATYVISSNMNSVSDTHDDKGTFA